MANEQEKRGGMSRRTFVKGLVGATTIAGAEAIAQVGVQAGIDAAKAGFQALTDRKAEVAKQSAPAKSEGYVGELRFMSDEEYADKIAAQAKARKAASGLWTPDVAHAQAACDLTPEFQVGPTVYRNIPLLVPGGERRPNPYGVTGFGEFFREGAPHYNMVTGIEQVTIDGDDFRTTYPIKPNTRYNLGRPGQPGNTPPFGYNLDGGMWEYASGAEAGEEAFFAWECTPTGGMAQNMLVEKSIWAHEQWDRIAEYNPAPSEKQNPIGIKRFTRTVNDPGRIWNRVRRGHFFFISWPAKDEQFAADQLEGYLQISKSNHADFIIALDTSNGRTFHGTAFIGEYPGGRREGFKLNSETLFRNWDNFSGQGVDRTALDRITPVNAVRRI